MIEKLTQAIYYKGAEFELVRRPDVIWVGCVDYADKSDIGATLKRFQGLVESAPIKEKINPDWSAALSINYTRDDKPCGIMFANESYTDEQDKRYDIFTQPGGLWLRVKGDNKNAKALLDKDKADLYEFFGALRNAAKANGYIQNPDVPVEVEYHCHAEYNTPPHSCFAYIPVTEYADTPECAKENNMQYPAQYRIKPKGKTAVYTGAGWPHSNAYPAVFAAVCLFYGKETRLNEKGEQFNDDLQYRIQGALSTEAYGIQYSNLFEDGHLQNCLGLYGIKPQVVDCSEWEERRVCEFVRAAVAGNKTVIIEPKAYADMHFVFGYADDGQTLFCCPFLDGDDNKNRSFDFRNYKKRKNRCADVRRLIILEDGGEYVQAREVYIQSLKHALDMMTVPSPSMDFTRLKGAGTGIYDAWIALLQEANAENSDVYYMQFPVFPQFIILYENRLHFREFLKECAKTYGELPDLMTLIEKSEETLRLVFEKAELGFHREDGDPIYSALTHNRRRDLLIGVLEKCRTIDTEIIALLERVCGVIRHD
ncbi:MAG: hypothetical protein PHZ09_06600 [Eubacteriales bacterium]|nr:hypothetical protein [Eubacteriales bacterium]